MTTAEVYDIIAREASTLESMVLVSKVIQNRMKERNMTALEVVSEPHQFSSWEPRFRIHQKQRTGQELKMAMDAWDLAWRSDMPVNLFYADSIPEPSWAKHPRVKFITKIKEPNGYFSKFYQEVR